MRSRSAPKPAETAAGIEPETFRCSASRSPRFEPHGGRCVWWNRGRACGACRCLDVRVCLGTGVWGEAAASVRRRCARLRIATRWSLRGSVRSCACRIYLYLIDLSSAASCYPSAHPGRGDTRPETHPEGENPTSHAHNHAIALTERHTQRRRA